MTIVITRSGKGSAISAGENDGNLDSMCGINEAQAATTYTVVAADQNRTIECSNASPIAVALDAIATIVAAIDTSDFDVTIKNVGAGATTITPNVADAIDDGSSTIVLAQYEYVTLQTDSTHAIWNIVNGNYDVVTETGTQTLTNKTHTAPVLNDPVINGDISGTGILDDDTMGTATDTTVASSESIKAYVDDPSHPAFRAYRNAAYTYTSGNDFIFDAETFDVTGDYAVGTGRFTPSVAGIYAITAKINTTTAKVISLTLEKNGSVIETQDFDPTGHLENMKAVTTLVSMNGTTDYVALVLVHTTTITISPRTDLVSFHGYRVQGTP